jgi:hypothetical protein
MSSFIFYQFHSIDNFLQVRSDLDLLAPIDLSNDGKVKNVTLFLNNDVRCSVGERCLDGSPLLGCDICAQMGRSLHVIPPSDGNSHALDPVAPTIHLLNALISHWCLLQFVVPSACVAYPDLWEVHA